MNTINLSFVAPDVESFTAALAAMALHGVPTASAVLSAPVTSPARQTPASATHERGPHETEYLTRAGAQRMKMSAEEKEMHGEDREACAKARLDAMGPETVEPVTVPEFEAQEKSQEGKSYNFDFEG